MIHREHSPKMKKKSPSHGRKDTRHCCVRKNQKLLNPPQKKKKKKKLKKKTKTPKTPTVDSRTLDPLPQPAPAAPAAPLYGRQVVKNRNKEVNN